MKDSPLRIGIPCDLEAEGGSGRFDSRLEPLAELLEPVDQLLVLCEESNRVSQNELAMVCGPNLIR